MKPEEHILLTNPNVQSIYASQSTSCAQRRLCHVNFIVLISGLRCRCGGSWRRPGVWGCLSEPRLGICWPDSSSHVIASDIFLGGTWFNRLRRRPVSTWRLRELFPALQPPPPEVLAKPSSACDYSPWVNGPFLSLTFGSRPNPSQIVS